MGESFVEDAAGRGFPPDWDGGNSSYKPPNKETFKETVSTRSVEWLTDKLERNAVHPGAGLPDCYASQFSFEVFNPMITYNDGEMQCSAFDGISAKDPEIRFFSVEMTGDGFRETFCFRDFLEGMKSARVPVSVTNVEGDDLFWDSSSQTLRLFSYGQRISDDFASNVDTPSKRDIFFERCIVSDDYGRKPLLVSKQDFFGDKTLEKFRFHPPDKVSTGEMDNYVLVYHDRSGRIRSSRIDPSLNQLVTRGARYFRTEFGLESELQESHLQANAYKMVCGISPENLSCYTRKEEGTIFEPVFSRVRSPGMLFPTQLGNEMSLEYAQKFIGLLGQDGGLITSGAHPCELSGSSVMGLKTYQTTPFLYLSALQHLIRLGIKLDFDDLGRRIDAPTDQ